MDRTSQQADLFSGATQPEGFRYAAGVFSPAEEQGFVGVIAALPFKPFQFHGYEGNRRTVSFGWRYDYGARRIQRADEFPEALSPLRDKAGLFARQPPTAFEQILVTEYAPGAGIGWHRDKPDFGDVVAFSFLAPCRLRFRRALADGWERVTHEVQARSAYILSGPARWMWHHSIPALEQLRYSVTFRTLR